MNLKLDSNYQKSLLLNENSFLMASSSETVSNATSKANLATNSRPIILNQNQNQVKPNIIHHFQIKKSQSFSKPLKIENSLNEKNSIEIKIQELQPNKNQGSPKSIESRSTVTTAGGGGGGSNSKNHVQFLLPVNTNLTQFNSSSTAQPISATPSNTAATNSLSSLNGNGNTIQPTKTELIGTNTTSKVSNRIQSTLPLKNITTIRSSSFRNRNVPTAKYDQIINSNQSINNSVNPTQLANNLASVNKQLEQNKTNQQILSNTEPLIKSKNNSRSYENINMIKVNEFKNVDELNSNNSNTTQPSIHRLIKMASSWNGGKGRSDSSASTFFKYPKISESSLISQSKIRQTQMFLNEDNKCMNSCESVMSRKISEYNEKSTYRGVNSNNKDDDELNTNRSRTPIRILPITSRMTFGTNSMGDSSKKSANSEINEASSTMVNNIWSHSNVTNSASEISEGSSAKESSFANYLSRKNQTSKSFNLVHINRNINPMKISATNNNQLNRVSQLPIQIQ